ncbi:unnamed protein product [Lepeophtheirus salmonis]|uniref:(salmon louse) hypothetical protein n=1 Tax=Lepeophtheirus salmonis TaxID=72036 RepID=A0A7R8CXA6_LEPSM|nr:unnamed protein product [Lepeophtheirus salmonis]CAF2958696.1 unnamed protein product [Lepeophtheirus salmonis]
MDIPIRETLLLFMLFYSNNNVAGSSSSNQSIVISFEDRLEIIDGESTNVIESFSLSPTVNYIVSITSDGHKLFLSDYRDEGTTIFEVSLGKKLQILPLVEQNSLNMAEGIAFDSKSKKLYFSDSRKRQISSILLTKEKKLQNVITMDSPHGKLRDVAIDSCNRRLYWVNWDSNRPRIEFLNLDLNSYNSSATQIFIDSNLSKPRSLIYDYWDLRLYWIDTDENHKYKIERAFSDSSGRTVVCKGNDNSPYDITVTENHIFWSDWMNMSSRPMGIASLSFPNKCIEKESVIKYSTELVEETNDNIMKPSTVTMSSEICQNYCIHGNCSLSAINFPICHCQFGYSGSRCQNDLCHNYCLNKGICRFPTSNKGKPICQCIGEFNGARCQFDMSKDRNNVQQIKESPTSKVFLYGFVLTSSSTGLLLLLLTAITVRTYREKKGVYSEICIGKTTNCSSFVDIEDCCQMTLCDTPCVEATFRKPRRRGLSHGDDDKAVLLDNDSLVNKEENLF